MNFHPHLKEFKQQGYTIFENVYDTASMEQWKGKFNELQQEAVTNKKRPWWFGHMLERAPRLMLPAVAHPTILEFAELLLGPFVQLDNLTLAGFPSSTKEEINGTVSGWHRDRWGQVPRSDAYERPHAINAIAYLQDLTEEFGPLRVIPGSHRQPLTLTAEERNRPHPDEKIHHLRAGDVVVIHNNLIHSGTPNTSGQTRYFFSVYYNLTWLKPTDNHNGPNVQALIQEARTANDHRLLRLLGVDEKLRARNNHGFLSDDEEMWRQWSEEDKQQRKDGAEPDTKE